MGLFSSKKKDKMLPRPELPPLKFPDLPVEDLPSYPPMQGMSSGEAQTLRGAVQSPEFTLFQRQFMPQMPQEEMLSLGMHEEMERPLFVRIEKYKDVMETLNELKDKMKDAGDVLRELNRIKDEEEQELASWHHDLEAIKEKLMTIDKSLFESA